MSDRSLGDAIENLSQKRHVISEAALRAKERFDEEQALRNAPPVMTKKQESLTEAFAQSVDLLGAIFQKSRFDEVASFISNPSRMIILNGVIGLFRGIGFGIGLVFVGVFVVAALKDTAVASAFVQWLLSR